MDWQPIETAPKNGEEILLASGYCSPIRIGFWDTARGGVWSVWPGRELIRPVHWMPLPAAPDERKEG